MKPETVRRFEMLYPASVLAWLAASALSWDERQALTARSPALVGYEWLVPAGFAGVLALSVLIWALVRRRSPAGRVMAMVGGVFSALALVIVAGRLVVGHSADPVATLLSLLASGLNVAATAGLFAPAARAWFDRSEAEVLS
ncbi:hypothetical protein [Sphingomonas sp.]|uniref:hypothetical protein n=1 Tax=Sphingomonas sp. TaxID=28214 RepID=UPI0035C81797